MQRHIQLWSAFTSAEIFVMVIYNVSIKFQEDKWKKLWLQRIKPSFSPIGNMLGVSYYIITTATHFRQRLNKQLLDYVLGDNKCGQFQLKAQGCLILKYNSLLRGVNCFISFCLMGFWFYCSYMTTVKMLMGVVFSVSMLQLNTFCIVTACKAESQ